MSLGLGPTLSGSLTEWPDTAGPRAADAKSDVSSIGCPANPGNGSGGSCAAPGSGSSDNNSGPGDGYSFYGGPSFNDPSPGGSGYFNSSGDYFGTMEPGQMYLLNSPVGCNQPGLPVSPKGCVNPDTEILMYPEGSKRAGDIGRGDLVFARDTDGQPCGEEVTDVVCTVQPCVELELESGTRITCSVSHEAMVYGRGVIGGEPIAAACLRLSDKLCTQINAFIAIRSIIRVEDGPVVQISLAGPGHVYVTNGFWSHNKQQAWP